MPGPKARRALAAAALALVAGASAFAQAPARVEVERQGETARVRLIYPDRLGGALAAEADIAAGAVLVARLSEAASFDPALIADAAPDLVARGRLDPDGRTLRLALMRSLEPRVSVSHNIVAIDLAPPGAEPLPDVVSPHEAAERAAEEAARRAAEARANAPPPPPPPPVPVEVRAAESSEYTRVEFRWPEPASYALRREGGTAVLDFARNAAADIVDLSVEPPRGLRDVLQDPDDASVFRFELEPGFDARAWSDGDRVLLDVFDPARAGVGDMLAALEAYADELEAAAGSGDAPAEAEAEPDPAADGDAPARLVDAAADAPAPEARPDPVPASGVVPVAVRPVGQDLSLSFEWAALPGAAAFRRGDAIWIAFDAAADLDLAELTAAGRRHVLGYQALKGEDWTAMRITAPAATQASVRADASVWTLHLSDQLPEPPRPVQIARDTSLSAPASLRFSLEGPRGVRRIADPVVGDAILVATADGEPRGVITERRLVEATILRSMHGVALAATADDLTLSAGAGEAVLSRPGGLALSRPGGASVSGEPAETVSPGFLDLQAWRGDRPFLDGLAARRAASAEEDADALLDLARFYLAWELAPEALGALDRAEAARPALKGSPQASAIRGAASLVLGRLDEARAAFNADALTGDPAARPWRGLVAAERGDYAEARRAFEAGREAVFFHDARWRARFRLAHARAALEVNDVGAADALLDALAGDEPDARTAAEAELLRARLDLRNGEREAARARFAALEREGYEPVRARAALERLRLDLDAGRIGPAEAAEALESLRFRWRGDGTELAATRLLGQWYAEAGRYARALQVMTDAEARFAGDPKARALGDDARALFRRLFLDGEADRMDPIDAITLFREYAIDTDAPLIPINADGDRMVRRFVDRLVRLDLLDEAADYLQHQIDNRSTLSGLARAQVAGDLAVIYLLADRERDALGALQQTRIAGLPRELVRERRLLEARARFGLGLNDHARELISNDDGPEAARLRADIAWSERDWSQAGRRIEALLGERWRSGEPLSPAETHDVLRGGIAYALAGDRGSVQRLAARYGAAMAATPHASAFSLVTSETLSAGDARLADLAADLAGMEGADAFMAGFADRFEGGPGES